MSGIAVAPAQVVAVLLADGWHCIVPGSLSIGTLSFGAEAGLGTPGFRFEQADSGSPYGPATVAGPLGSIIAVRQVGSAARRPGELPRPVSGRWTRPAAEAVA